MLALKVCLAFLAIAVGASAPVRAQTAVDLELVLAVDASGSVSQERFVLQQRGYVAAFRDPRLLQAIRSGAARVDCRHHDAMDRPGHAGAGGAVDVDRG